MIRLAHIINPVAAPQGSELDRIQPITFESIIRAKAFTSADVEVELFAVGYSEDRAVASQEFKTLRDLERSVLDKREFKKKRKLPFIKDILSRLYEATDAEWLIYTNTDICLMPQFYDAVAAMISKLDHDAIVITRRRISSKYSAVSDLPQMYSELGGYHPGYDCFVFHRSLFEKLVIDDICVGVPFIEVSLLHNLIAFATKLKHIDDQHLTFHIGMEVMPPVDKEYYDYNRGVYEQKVFPNIKPLLRSDKFPFSEQPWYKRFFKWGLNPCYSTALMLELEGKSLLRRLKMLVDEWRWRAISK
jgi:hypothetical protein